LRLDEAALGDLELAPERLSLLRACLLIAGYGRAYSSADFG
jgi:hypothetical protein